MKLSQLLPASGSMARSVVHLASGAALGQLIAVASTPFLTRLYNPAEFGVLAAGSSIVSIVVVLASLRYEIAIPLPRDDDGASDLIVLCAGFLVIVTLITGLAFVAFGPQISAALQAPALTPYLGLLLLSLLAAGFNQILTQWAVRVRDFSALAATRVTQSISMAVAQIGLGLLGAHAGALLLGDALGRAGGSWRFSVALWRREAASLRRVTWRSLRAAAVRFRRFPLFAGPSALINVVLLQAPVVLLLALYGAHMGGLYLLVHRVSSLPIRVIGTSVAQVYFGEASRRLSDDPASLQALFRTTTRQLALAGALPTILVMLLAPTVFPIVFGAEWAEGGEFLAVLGPMYFLLFVTYPVSATLDVLERQDLNLIAEIIGFLATAAVMLIAETQGLTPLHAVMGLAVAGSLNSIAHLGFSWYALRRHTAGRDRRAGTA